MPGSRRQTWPLLGRALASVGHELNNLVGVVRSYAAFIEEATSGTAASDARVIQSSGEKLASLARQLTVFGHPREQAPELVELGPFLRDMHGFLQRSLGELRRLHLTDGAQAGSALVRRAALARALVELTFAAHEVLPAASALSLGVERDGDARGQPRVKLWLREERAADDSATEAALGFQRLSSLVDWDVLRGAFGEQRATLWEDEDWRGGVGVVLSFAAEGRPDAPAPLTTSDAPARGEAVLALVVDDDAHVRLALSRILTDVGAEVITAPTGLHALQKLQTSPIDLLIADQLMPGMEGTRLLETAYKTWPSVVRVVYTGYLSAGLVVDAVNRANVHKLLAKDMPPELLRQQLGEVVREIRSRRPT